MRNSPGGSHTPVRLPASLDQQLNWYALAASAAGVSLLALASPLEAKIVYTKTYQVIGSNGIYGLDLNHDGTMDFIIRDRVSFAYTGLFLSAREAFGNAVEGSNAEAAALIKGAPIGPGQHFIVAASSYAGERMAVATCTVEGGCRTSGPWVNVTDRYLGLKFQISGKTHYGWARLKVAAGNSQVTAKLTGYAYETISNKTIRAGQTSGNADASQSEPESAGSGRVPAVSATPVSAGVQAASLARLALGAQSASLGRRP